MAGKSLWRLGCFYLHYCFSSPKPQDGLYHQRQAILRNSDTAQDGAWRLLVSMRSWRRQARRPIYRLLPLIVVSLVLSTAFGIASVFSSHVTTDTANEVLLKGDGCGVLEISDTSNYSAVYSYFKPYHAQLCSKFLNYGLQCYSNKSASEHADGCNLYTTAQLPLTVSPKASCPFNETMCKLREDNLVLDTGRLNSLKHFGINAPPENQFDVRIIHECAPLVTEGFVETVNSTDTGTVARVFYGEGSNGALHPREWTFEVPLEFPYNPENGTGYVGTTRPEYNVGSVFAVFLLSTSHTDNYAGIWKRLLERNPRSKTPEVRCGHLFPSYAGRTPMFLSCFSQRPAYDSPHPWMILGSLPIAMLPYCRTTITRRDLPGSKTRPLML